MRDMGAMLMAAILSPHLQGCKHIVKIVPRARMVIERGLGAQGSVEWEKSYTFPCEDSDGCESFEDYASWKKLTAHRACSLLGIEMVVEQPSDWNGAMKWAMNGEFDNEKMTITITTSKPDIDPMIDTHSCRETWPDHKKAAMNYMREMATVLDHKLTIVEVG